MHRTGSFCYTGHHSLHDQIIMIATFYFDMLWFHGSGANGIPHQPSIASTRACEEDPHSTTATATNRRPHELRNVREVLGSMGDIDQRLKREKSDNEDKGWQ
jgi:hypothetical protein